jgi:hypothetical protein
MIGNRFYDILGLPFGASEQLIKKRYKELAKKYHPDRNPSPDANKRFIEINEAYIYLLSKDKIPAKSFEEQQREKAEEEQRAYREKAWNYAREKKIRDEEELLEFYRSLRKGWSWFTFKSVTILCGVVLFVMIVDFFLPTQAIPEVVTEYSNDIYHSVGGNEVSLIKTNSGKYLWTNEYYNKDFNYNPFFILESSQIFQNPITAKIYAGNQFFEIPIHFTVYWAQFVLSPFLLFPIFVYFCKKDNAFFVIGHYLTRYVSGILVGLYLLTEDRWFHLITIGFF